MEERIGFGKRAGAVLIDILVVGVGGGILGVLLGGVLGSAIGGASGQENGVLAGGAIGAVVGSAIIITVLGLLYGLIEAFTGASPGKMILGIKIGTDQGQIAPVGVLFARYGLKNISIIGRVFSVVTGIVFLGPIFQLCGIAIFLGCFMALAESKQALHDRIVGTAVYPAEALIPASKI